MSNNLGIPEMTSGTADKETFLNDIFQIVDASVTQALNIDGSVNSAPDPQSVKNYIKLVATTVPLAGTTITLPITEHVYILANDPASAGPATWKVGASQVVTAPGASILAHIDGTSIVAVGSAAKLANLYDVDFSTPPTDGQALVWNAVAGKWKPGTVAAGGGSGGGSGGGTRAFRYYKLACTYASDDGYTGLCTLALRNTAGGPNVAQANLLGDAPTYANWFDGNDSTGHFEGGNPSPVLILDYVTPQTFLELYMVSYNNYPNEAPNPIAISGSDDNITYIDIQTVNTGFLHNGTSQTRTIALTPLNN